jgi:precorrin isomerase
MPTRYTVWVKNRQLEAKLVIVCDVPDVSAAIQQALEQAAPNWKCGTDILSVYGIAEGDVYGALQ